jgi:hypothetical protein
MMSKWHSDHTVSDCRSIYSTPKHLDAKSWYRHSVNAISQRITKDNSLHAAGAIMGAMGDYLFESLGRPRWFIGREMFELLVDTTIDNDITNIFWPFDSMSFVFEKGILIDDVPLRWFRIFRNKSDLSKSILIDAFGETSVAVFDTMTDKAFSGKADFGWSRSTRDYNENTKKEDSMEVDFSIRANESSIALDKDDVKREIRPQRMVKKIATTALLYYAARPEFIIPYTLPRSDRFNQHGSRNNCRIALMPTSKKVYLPHAISSVASGRSVKPHYRGWVLRTLRHEKYRRNADGTFRTVLIPPCAINKNLSDN